MHWIEGDGEAPPTLIWSNQVGLGLPDPLRYSGEQCAAELSLAEDVRGVKRVEHQLEGHPGQQQFAGRPSATPHLGCKLESLVVVIDSCRGSKLGSFHPRVQLAVKCSQTNRIVTPKHRAYSERVGIRYLDVVVPAEGESELSKYLVPGVLGLAGRLPEGVAMGLSLSETHIPLPDANLLSRTIDRSGALGFPMDLEPQGLRIPERFQQVSGLHAIIDTDASQIGRQVFDVVKLRDRLDMLHTKIRMAFDASVTEHALKVWQ